MRVIALRQLSSKQLNSKAREHQHQCEKQNGNLEENPSIGEGTKQQNSSPSPKKTQPFTNQENLFESFEDLAHHLPHLGHQLEDAQWSQAAQHHQQLRSGLRRDIRRQPAQKDQTHLHRYQEYSERGSNNTDRCVSPFIS